jgi:DNA invertase Pin-like site-specific DNA recombinase
MESGVLLPRALPAGLTTHKGLSWLVMSKTAIYLRQSLDRTGDEAAIDRQRAACRALAKQKGWTGLVEYVDNDRSATNGTRPAYLELLAAIRAGKVNAIVCWHVDRLYRQPRDLEDLIELAEAHSVKLATCVGDIDLSTDMGRLMARVVGAFNKNEGERKAARQKLAAKQMAERGLPKWHNAFGYIDGEHKPHPVEAKLVRKAYESVLGGASLSGLAREWNAKGHIGRTGKPWSASTLSLFLRSPRNAGLRVHNDVIVGEGTWPALVDESTWRATQAVLSDPARRPGPKTVRRHFLTGVLRCGVCADGGRIIGYHGPREQRYRCHKCLKVSISKADTDDLIRRIVCGRLARPDAKDLLIDRDAPDLDKLTAEANTLRARRIELATELADGELTVAELRAIRERLTAKLDAIESRMADASAVRVFADVPLGTNRVHRVFTKMDVDRQRAIINLLLTATVMPSTRRGRVAFDPERIAIVWR